MVNKRHIIFFIVVIALSLFAFEHLYFILRGDASQVNLINHFLVNIPACIVVGFIDYFVIKGTYKKRYGNDTIRITVNLILTNLLAILFSVITNYFLSFFIPHDFHIWEITLPLILWNSLVVLFIEIFFYNQRQVETERRMALMEKEKMEYQYETLKAQINPHFLFNSLNVLSSLAYKDAEKTNLFAKKMSGVYRYLLLTNSKPTVAVREELLFLESYLFLEQIRFENALFVEISNPDADMARQIIPVSLQLLVENAIKHNIATINNPLTIKICVTDEEITVSNNLKLRSSVDKGGVGLKNLQKQYALYGKTIQIVQTDTDFIVKIPYI